MSGFISSVVSVATAAILWAATTEMTSVYRFGGLDTDTNTMFLQDQNTPDSQNVVTDVGPGVGPRKGFVDFSTNTALQSWVFYPSNGTKYHIIREGTNLLATTGNGTYNTLVSTVASGVNVAATQLGDRFFFGSTSDYLKYWDMTNVVTATSTLTPASLVAHKGRLFAAGDGDAPRTIYISKFADGTTWTATADADNEADSVQLGGGVDEKVNGLYASYNDAVIVFRNSSFLGLYGNRRGGFGLRTFSDTVGSAYPESAKECDGVLRFLGPSRAIYEWNGARIVKISEPIDTLMATVAQGDASLRSFSFTSQADFNTGTNYQTTNYITSGDVQLTTWTRTDTTDADFNAFTSSSSVTISGNQVKLSTNNVDMENNSFESGSGTTANNWTRVDLVPPDRVNSFVVCSTTIYDGSWMLRSSSSFGISVQTYDALTGTQLLSQFVSASSGTACNWYTAYIDLSAYVGRSLYIKIERTGGGYVHSDNFICSGGTMSYRWLREDSNAYFEFDSFTEGRSSITSGTITGATFDTSLTSAAWTPSGATTVANGNSITFQTQSSSDGSTWQSAVAWSTGSAPASDFRRYLRYVVNFSTDGTNGTALPYVDDVTLAARANFGAWVSPAIDASGMSSFGSFSEDTTLGGGTVGFAVYTDTDTSMTITNGVPVAATFVASQTITDSAIPTMSTGTYLRLGQQYSITVSTHDPANHSLGIEWNTGSTVLAPALWTKQRYWLPVAVNSTTNNRVLVYDKNREWQLYNGLNMAAAVVYNGEVIFGNTGGLFKAETGTTDDGAAIEAYYRTKDYPLAGVDTLFALNEVRLTGTESADALGTTYYVNGRTAGTAMGDFDMDAASGINTVKLPVPADAATQFMRTIGLKFDVTGTTDWKLLMGNLYYERERQPE